MLPPLPEKLMMMLAANTALFGAIALVLWGVEALWRRFGKKTAKVFPGHERMGAMASLGFAVRQMPWIVGVALALSAAATLTARRLGLDLPSQDMLKWLSGDTYSMPIKAAVVAFATIEAPLLEELVFRRFLFRAFLRCMPLWGAAALSGALFALMHCNALVFIPLAFLGGAFAWIYWRTGRIASAMFAHFIFNAINVVLLLSFPELENM